MTRPSSRSGVAALGHPDRVRGAIEHEGIEVVVYDQARVEPTLACFQRADDLGHILSASMRNR